MCFNAGREELFDELRDAFDKHHTHATAEIDRFGWLTIRPSGPYLLLCFDCFEKGRWTGVVGGGDRGTAHKEFGEDIKGEGSIHIFRRSKGAQIWRFL
jgi:hypothetical protein